MLVPWSMCEKHKQYLVWFKSFISLIQESTLFSGFNMSLYIPVSTLGSTLGMFSYDWNHLVRIFGSVCVCVCVDPLTCPL